MLHFQRQKHAAEEAKELHLRLLDRAEGADDRGPGRVLLRQDHADRGQGEFCVAYHSLQDHADLGDRLGVSRHQPIKSFLQVVLHEPDHEPMPTTSGMSIRPGVSAHLAFKRTEVSQNHGIMILIMIVIKVATQHKILSGVIILSAYMHTQAPGTHEYSDYSQLNLQPP